MNDLSTDLSTTWRRATDAWRSGDALPVLHPALLWGDEPRGDLNCLRVGLITDTYLPVANGVTHMVALLARILVAWGHEPHIFTFAAPGAVQASLRDHEGIHVHHASALPISRAGYYFGVRYPLRMKKLLREMDVLHVHHPFISGRLVWRVARPEQPIIFTNHTRYDIYSHYVQQWMPFVPEDVVQDRLTYSAARFANRCDCVISPSESVAEVLREWGVRAPIETIPNGIQLQNFRLAREAAQKSNAERQAFRSRHGIPEDAKAVVYLGRLTPEKNVDGLLHAFALARRDAPEARLVLIGDGPTEAEYKQLARQLKINDVVHFTGALPYSEVPTAFASCDLFASASVSEVHPLTFIEAMAAGLACVGTISPGVADTVRHGDTGWLCEPGNENFAAALVEALRDEAERKARATQGAIDSEAYSIENTARRSLDLYREALQVRREKAAEAAALEAAASQNSDN